MKKTTLIILLICCATLNSFAQLGNNNSEKELTSRPINLESAMQEFLSKRVPQLEKDLFLKNVVTNLKEYDVKVYDFECDKNDQLLLNIINAYKTDVIYAYQQIHEKAGQGSIYSILFAFDSNIEIRTNINQELWLINVKDNKQPQFRTCYALTYEPTPNVPERILGHIYLVKSKRPDILKNANAKKQFTSNKFVIEGTIDENVIDSCYNIYISDSHEEIQDNNFIDCILVKNNKFHYEVELDRIKAGRLRAIFPGDKPCPAWMDFYFIPGLTIHMTVHNGYYEMEEARIYNEVLTTMFNREALDENIHDINDLFGINKNITTITIPTDENGNPRLESIPNPPLDIVPDHRSNSTSELSDDYLVQEKNLNKRNKKAEVSEKDIEAMEQVLSGYHEMLRLTNSQIQELRKQVTSSTDPDYYEVKKRLISLHKRAEKITQKLNTLLDKYAKQIMK